MAEVRILGWSNSTNIEIGDHDLTCLKKLQGKFKCVYELFLQYSIFCKGVTGLQSSVYSQALNSRDDSDNDFFKSEKFIEAEFLLTSHAVTFVKFIDLYPPLLGKALASLPEKTWAKNVVNSIYDCPQSYYSLLNELRHAAVHNLVRFTVSNGVKRVQYSKSAINTFGYFLHLENFLLRGARKNKRKFIAPKAHFLADDQGLVDLIKAFTDTSNEIYLKLIQPKADKIKEQFFLLESALEQILNKYSLLDNQVLNGKHQNQISIWDSNDSVIFDSIVLLRTKQLVLNIRRPPGTTFLSIAPSNQS